MKNYSHEELFIKERKLEQKDRAKKGEILQGIVYALMQARVHFDVAEQLSSKKETLPLSFMHLTYGCEELGKINYFTEQLFQTKELENVMKQYKSMFRSHENKIENFLSFTSKVLKMNSFNIKINGNSNFTGGGDLIENLLNIFDPSMAKEYHELRMKIQYTDFHNKISTSPNHEMEKLKSFDIKSFVILLRGIIDKTLKVCENIVPSLFVILQECFIETDPKKIKYQKKEINRRVDRFLPSLRLIANDFLVENTGKSIEDFKPSDMNGININFKNDVMPHLNNMIESEEEIPLIFIFPPLKEKYKQKYREYAPEKKDIIRT